MDNPFVDQPRVPFPWREECRGFRLHRWLSCLCLLCMPLGGGAEDQPTPSSQPSRTFGYGPERNSYLESMMRAHRERARDRSRAIRDSLEGRGPHPDPWTPPSIYAKRRLSSARHEAIRSRAIQLPPNELLPAPLGAANPAVDARPKQPFQKPPSDEPPTFGHGPYGWAPYGWPAP